jgi:hypothetical protein
VLVSSTAPVPLTLADERVRSQKWQSDHQSVAYSITSWGGKQRRRHVETKRPRLITRFVSLTIWLASAVCPESGPWGRFACV